MTELRRIYWLRLGLRWLAVLAAAWLAAGLVAALATGQSPSAYRPATAATLVLPALVLAGLGATALRQRSRDRLRRDPRRQFSAEQRRDGLARAGGRCELEAGYRSRCERTATNGAHFVPWSAGGSTTMANFVATCSRCRRFRAPQLPSPGARRRLEERRGGYFPPGAPTTAGERNPVSGQAPAWLSG
ncbi:HNH endonuclease [Arthrobacter sp. I2-34]|uniref:HNH endonuclease n=1 Tax=Arthrobacter hankyongi TaxID=2904801 RepID=A0ABS9L2R9_9MICC|nr:HNH endonuclease [Arthrobacter hankyongi]MCG2620970.1 HNH endonuclease [Arthrobacter hankyongi]